MKRITIIMALLTVACSFTYGQASTDSISMIKVFGGYEFYQGDKKLNLRKLARVMESNEKAFEELESARSSNILVNIVGFAGGYMVGWQIGTALGGGEPNWIIAGIGAGLIVVSIPISQSFIKKAKKAVEIFNGGLKTSSFWDKNKLRLSLTGGGIGLTLKF